MDDKSTPMLLPYEPDKYWAKICEIVREEIDRSKHAREKVQFATAGLDYKPLFKFDEICAIFKVSRPTIYDWIKHGKLKPYKIRSRVYFLWNDLQPLLDPL